jgi:hypothetical protein
VIRVEVFGHTDLSVGYGSRSPKLPAASYSDLPTSVPDILVPASTGLVVRVPFVPLLKSATIQNETFNFSPFWLLRFEHHPTKNIGELQ